MRRRRRESDFEPPPERPPRFPYGLSDDPNESYRIIHEYVVSLLAWQERTGLRVWQSWGLPQKEDWQDGDIVTESEYLRRARSYWRG